jgi:hypothetical protein
MTSTATDYSIDPGKDAGVTDTCDDAAYCFYCNGPETD